MTFVLFSLGFPPEKGGTEKNQISLGGKWGQISSFMPRLKPSPRPRRGVQGVLGTKARTPEPSFQME